MGLRGAIIILIVLGIGIFLTRTILQDFLPDEPVVESQGLQEFIQNADQLFDLSLYAIGGLLIILIIIGIAGGGKGKKKELKELEAVEEEEEEEEE